VAVKQVAAEGGHTAPMTTASSHPDRVRISLREHGVADVAMTRGDKMNALDPAMFAALLAAIETLKATPGLRAVVLHGEGRAFCAGLDRASFAALATAGAGSPVSDLGPRTHGIANGPQQIALGWRTLAVPVLAAVQGAAFGGGLQLALGADIRLLGPQAQLSVMEIKWGLVPDMAGMVLMKSLMRDDVLRELCYSGRVLGAAEAVALGLGTRVVADPLAEAHALALAIAQRSPSAVRAAKRLLNQAAHTLDDQAAALLQAESDEQIALMAGPNQREAVLANLEKRSPCFDD
jgi:enoyl-CoA hydratase/carnithine racemase